MATATTCGTEIREEATKAGVEPVFVRDNGKQGDARCTLWDCGGVLAIDTNGRAIWDTSDRETWRAALGACGLPTSFTWRLTVDSMGGDPLGLGAEFESLYGSPIQAAIEDEAMEEADRRFREFAGTMHDRTTGLDSMCVGVVRED